MTEVLNRHRRGVTCAAWGRGGRLALGGRDQQVGSHCYPTLPYPTLIAVFGHGHLVRQGLRLHGWTSVAAC